GEIALLDPAPARRPAASAEQIQSGAAVLSQAKQPLIIAGGGVIASRASAALQTLAEFLQAPVLTTAEGKGALSDRHPLALGAMRLRQDPIVEYLAQIDIVLAVGPRLGFSQLFSRQEGVEASGFFTALGGEGGGEDGGGRGEMGAYLHARGRLGG